MMLVVLDKIYIFKTLREGGQVHSAEINTENQCIV